MYIVSHTLYSKATHSTDFRKFTALCLFRRCRPARARNRLVSPPANAASCYATFAPTKHYGILTHNTRWQAAFTFN